MNYRIFLIVFLIIMVYGCSDEDDKVSILYEVNDIIISNKSFTSKGFHVTDDLFVCYSFSERQGVFSIIKGMNFLDMIIFIESASYFDSIEILFNKETQLVGLFTNNTLSVYYDINDQVGGSLLEAPKKNIFSSWSENGHEWNLEVANSLVESYESLEIGRKKGTEE